MNQIVSWNRDASRADLECASQILRNGGLVGFPTETGYVVAADATHIDSVRLLAKHNARLPLLLPIPFHLEDWLPDISPLGKRLARKIWPGPAVIVGDGAERGRVDKLPDAVRSVLLQNDSLAFRSSVYEVPWELSNHANPLVIAELGLDEKPAHSAAELVEQWGEQVEIVFDGGATTANKTPMIVRLSGSHYSVEAGEAASHVAIDDAARCRIIFVCTGNTCRSPMAEAFFRNELAAGMNCSPDELVELGFIVQSAGLSAATGCAATAESTKIVEELGGDLRDHQSCLLTLELLLQSDYLFAMTQNHLAVLQNNLFMDGAYCGLLSDDDIPDPFGAPEEVYRECAQHILQCVKKWAPRIQHEEAAVRPKPAGRPNG